jgi:hypothetical protein
MATKSNAISAPESKQNETAAMVQAALAETSIAEYKGTWTGTPYLVFLHPKQSTYARTLSKFPSASEGEPFVIVPEPDDPVKLDPFKFYLLHAKGYFAQFDNSGYPVAVTESEEEAKQDRKWKDVVESVILCEVNGGLIATRATFKTTKVKPARLAMDAYKLASTPQWAEKSAEHKASLMIPAPQLRFYTVVKVKPQQTSRSSGNLYQPADGIVRPSGVADWKLLGEWFTAPLNRAKLEACKQSFTNRCAELEELIDV